MLAGVDDTEPGWRPDDTILIDLPDGQVVCCGIVNIAEDGTVGRPRVFRGWPNIVASPTLTPRRSWQDRAARQSNVGGPRIPR